MSLIDYWFSRPNIWFNSSESDDLDILEKYGSYLEYDNLYKTYIELLKNDKSNKEYLEFILICDQLSRHKYRNNKGELAKYDKFALDIARMVIENNKSLEGFTAGERCFIMMPLRHSDNIENNEMILEMVKEFRMNNDISIYRRFYKATVKKLGLLKNDEAIKTPVEVDRDIVFNSIIGVLDNGSIKEIVYTGKYTAGNNIIEEFEKFIEYIGVRMFNISISGGVDSMVAAYILRLLRDKYSLDIIATHIDYNNRGTSKLDRELCVRWCKELGINVYVRKIDEISRKRDKDREIYESITKNTRYDIYKKLGRHVILGHNRDDTVENIISNIIKRKNYDNLFGMTIYPTTDTLLCRPMLNIPKSDIYTFAKENKIPYVYDSTPSWSERGKKRDELIPYLDTFDKRIIPGLENISRYITSVHNVYSKTIDDLVDYSDNSIDKRVMNYDIAVWGDILFNISRKYSFGIISKKSVETSYIQLNKRRIGDKIVLSNKLWIQILKNKIRFILK